MAYSKGSNKNIYSGKKEVARRRKLSDQQPNFTSQGIRKRTN